MKYGIAYKNLTDAIVLIAAFIAIFCIVFAVLAFEAPQTVEDKETGEKITIDSAFEDPAVKVYIELAITFAINAMIGFMVRKWFLIPIAASVVSIVISMTIFLDGTIEKVAYAFVVLGIIGLAGNIIYAVLSIEEQKEEFKQMLKEKREAKHATKSK